MSKIIVHHNAVKYLKRLPKEIKERIKETLKQLESNPLNYPGIKQMYGEWTGYHRIRLGQLRVIFWYDSKEDIVYVDHIGPRGDVYK
jgi:mRNA interferase RelE/StbE